MFDWLRKAPKPPPAPAWTGVGVPLRWRADAHLPIPQWDQVTAPGEASDEQLHAFWTAAAGCWLDALRRHLGDGYRLAGSDEFLLLGAVGERQCRLALDYAEKTRRRILGVLPGIARDVGYGKQVMLILADTQTYYEYVSHYDADAGDQAELAMSSGIFINDGYGHFVFVAEDLDRIEPVIAHELTHNLLAHLALPAWVNEGIAVNTERRLCPVSRSEFDPRELTERFAGHWNAATIQQFWSGKSWLQAGDGNILSYELAATLVSLAARDDWQRFADFVNAADFTDGGEAAARRHLGFSLAVLAEAVLGAGAWSPEPTTWADGAEQGRFRVRPRGRRLTACALLDHS